MTEIQNARTRPLLLVGSHWSLITF